MELEDDTPEKILARERLKRLDRNPELDNFLSRVDEISDVIHCLSSSDPKLNERGLRRADILLHEKESSSASPPCMGPEGRMEVDPELQVTSSRSVINKVRDPDPQSGGGDMSQEAFMRMVESDAKERAENRQIRKRHSDKYKEEAIKLFRQGLYPEALSKFDKAIEWTRDCPLLYTNRALTYMKLDLYSKCIEDCDTALNLSETSLKARLYKAKALAATGNFDQARHIFLATKQLRPDSINLIKGYEVEVFGEAEDS